MAAITDHVPPRKLSLKRSLSADLGLTSKRVCLQSTTSPTSVEKTATATIPSDRSPQDQIPSRKQKRLQTTLSFCAASSARVTHWVTRGCWPTKDFTPDPTMTTLTGIRSRTSSSGQHLGSAPVTASDQKPSTDNSAQYRDRRYEILLECKGSFLVPSPLGITDESRKLCSSLLAEDQPIPKDTRFDPEVFEQSCANTQTKNEARVIKEIGLLITPSVEDLALWEVKYRYMIESFNEAWTSAVPFEGTRPQPDYSVGLRRSTFTQDQLAKLGWQFGLKTYSTATLDILFPFFTAEVKCGTTALTTADRQNAHSATVAVKGIVELYRTVRRENELHRNILAFSLSHDQQGVRIYGHYPTIESKMVRYHRHVVKIFDIVSEDGKDRWTAYRFVRNIYKSFAPDHRKRIMSAVDQLPDPTALTVTPSTRRSNMSTSDNVIASIPPYMDTDGFMIPSVPASVVAAQAPVGDVRELFEQMRKQNEQLQQQMREQREDSKQQIQQLISLLQQRDRT